MGKQTLSLFTCVAALLLGLVQAYGCPIPVYQYALEHWEPDPYQVVVYKDGELTSGQAEALELLRNAAAGDPLQANLEVTVSAVEPGQGTSLQLSFPEAVRTSPLIWQGDLTTDHVRKILSSPLRQQLAEAMLRRTSAVWIMLETGDAKVDRDMQALLEGQLQRLAKEIVVPDAADWGGESVEIDSNLNFSVLRLNPKDPDEALTVKMLMGIEPDLEDFAGHPMVFPVYGRGIVLYALVGRGIDENTIRAAAEFLAGPCSCQIKSANPGTDLLVSANWEQEIKKLTPAAVGGGVGTGGFLRSLDEAGSQEATDVAP